MPSNVTRYAVPPPLVATSEKVIDVSSEQDADAAGGDTVVGSPAAAAAAARAAVAARAAKAKVRFAKHSQIREKKWLCAVFAESLPVCVCVFVK